MKTFPLPFLVLLMLCSMTLHATAQRTIHDNSRLRDGDLLFVVTPTGNAITAVTSGIRSLPIDHVGIYHTENGQGMVLEANYDGVVDTPFDLFTHRNPQLLVGRVKGHIDIPQSILNAHSYLGRPYDFVFLPDNNAIYCSELVQKSYVDSSGQLLFSPIGMSFHNSEGQLLPYWIDFYSRRGLDVPEGQPGSNPGEMSRRKNVKIKYKITPIAK